MISDDWSPGTAVQGAVPQLSDGTRDASPRVTRGTSQAARGNLWLGSVAGFRRGRSDPTPPNGLKVPGAMGRTQVAVGGGAPCAPGLEPGTRAPRAGPGAGGPPVLGAANAAGAAKGHGLSGPRERSKWRSLRRYSFSWEEVE